MHTPAAHSLIPTYSIQMYLAVYLFVYMCRLHTAQSRSAPADPYLFNTNVSGGLFICAAAAPVPYPYFILLIHVPFAYRKVPQRTR